MSIINGFNVLFLISALKFTAANPFIHIYENFESKPAEFLFNSSIVIFLLTTGGILAGKIFFILEVIDL